VNGYQLIASLVQSLASLAWPLAFVTAIWLFRPKLLGLLPFLRLRYKDVDVSFRLDEAEKKAELPPSTEPPIEATPEEKSTFEKISDISPRAAILDLRNDLEETVRRFWEQQVEMDHRTELAFGTILRLMYRGECLDRKTLSILENLRVIGNQAAHGTAEFTKDDAMRYRTLVEEVTPRIKSGT
jgi:Domain of unknown function (DUF4145)